MFWLLPAVGALGGAMMNGKDPLKGALMGGALGALGGYGLGMTGGIPGAGAAMGAEQSAMLGAQEAGLGMDALGWKGATSGVPGLLNSVGGTTDGGLLGAAGNAAKTAANIKALMPTDQPIPTAPQFHTGGAGGLGDFYAGLQNQRMAQAKADLEKQLSRYQRINRMG